MGLNKFSGFVLLFCVFLLLCLKPHDCDGSEVAVKFLKAPLAFSNLTSATFVFQVLVGGNGDSCRNCSINCKVDDGIPSECEAREVSYKDLRDGSHTFEVCTSGSQGVGCASYSWTVDTVPPTADVRASTSFTDSLHVSVNISFSEPCTGGGGFRCSSVNACSLLVDGDGQVKPSTLKILQPNLKFSLVVGLSSIVQYGRVELVVDENSCTDGAGNKFTRTANSSFFVHFDRRSDFVNLMTHIPERQLQLQSEIRTVLATNNYKCLRVCLYFSKPVRNSTTEILNSLETILTPVVGPNQTAEVLLNPTSVKSLGKRRFNFLVEIKRSDIAIVTISLDSNSIISKQGTPFSPVEPVTFLFDFQRPEVKLITNSKMTREKRIPIRIKFTKPVLGFDSSTISVSGGNLMQRVNQVDRIIYAVENLEIQADGDIVNVTVPEGITRDIAGNKNLESNALVVTHYSVPTISSVISTFTTTSFAATSLAAGLLTLSTASLQFDGALPGPTSCWTSDPARNLFRMASHIQVFALSRWLAADLPIEYEEFVRGLEWSIPYLSLPWESRQIKPVVEPVKEGSRLPTSSLSYISNIHETGIFKSEQQEIENLIMPRSAKPQQVKRLEPEEYKSICENQVVKSLLGKNSDQDDGYRIMFWLVVIGGSLILLHTLLLLNLKYRSRNSEKQKDYGALVMPRFEIFLILHALPGIFKSSAALLRGGSPAGITVGILLLGFAASSLLSYLLFLCVGIAFEKLLKYEERHEEGYEGGPKLIHYFQDIIRVTLGRRRKGEWTPKNLQHSAHQIRLGPLFEDLRGPRVASAAPFIPKPVGILRIYYTMLGTIRQVFLGIMDSAWPEEKKNKAPPIISLCITSFQLFFLLLSKPFIERGAELAEIISVSCEVGMFAISLALPEDEQSSKKDKIRGTVMLLLAFVAFLVQLINEWVALYRQTKRLDPTGRKSFLSGLRTASIGSLRFLIPQESLPLLDQHRDGETGDTVSSGDRHSSSGSTRSSGTTGKAIWDLICTFVRRLQVQTKRLVQRFKAIFASE